MIPKERAKDLYDTFSRHADSGSESAKKCAKLCASEVIDTLTELYDMQSEVGYVVSLRVYWQQVKEEIEKL